MAKIADLKIDFKIDGAGKVALQLEKVNNAGEKAIGMVENFSKVGKVGFAAVTAAIAGVTAAAINIGKEFEKSLDTVATVSGATAEEIVKIEQAARRIGKETAFSANDAAEGMVNLARAGLSASDSIATVEPALMLAGAGAASMDTTTRLLTETMAQFGLKTEDASHISDVFAKAASSSQFSVEGLQTAMSYAGTVGGAFGISLEDTTAAVMMFRNAGLDASTAGTAYRQALVQLTTVSEKGTSVLGKYGLTFDDINPKTESFGNIVQILADRGVEASDVMQLFGARAGGAMASVISAAQRGENQFNEFANGLRDSTGTATEQYSQMMDNVQGSMDILRSALEEGALKIYDLINGPLNGFLKVITGIVGFLSDNLFIVIVSAGTLLATLAVAGWGVTTSFAAIAPAAAAAGTAIWAALAPVLPIILGISAALLVGYGIYKAFANNLWGISDAAKVAWEWIKTLGKSIADWFVGVWNKIKVLWAYVSEFSKLIYSNVASVMSVIIDGIVPVIKFLFNLVISYYKKWWSIVSSIGKFIADIAIIVGKFFAMIGTAVGKFFAMIGTAIGKFFANIGMKIANFAKIIYGKVVGFLEPIWDKIASVFGWIIDKIKWFIGAIKPYMKILAIILALPFTPIIIAIGAVIATFGGFENSIRAFVSSIAPIFKKLLILISTALNPANWTQPGKIKDAFGDLKAEVSNAASGIVDGFKNDITALQDKVKGAIANVQDKVKSSTATAVTKGLEESKDSVVAPAEELGQEVGAGIAKGLEESKDSVVAPAEELGQEIGAGIAKGIKNGISGVESELPGKIALKREAPFISQALGVEKLRKELGPLAQSLNDNLVSGLSDALKNAKSLLDVFKGIGNAVKQIGNLIYSEIIKQLTSTVVSRLFTSLAGGSGSVGSIFRAIGFADGGAITAGGAIQAVTRPTLIPTPQGPPVLAGEANETEYVIPETVLTGMSGGQTINIYTGNMVKNSDLDSITDVIQYAHRRRQKGLFT